MNLTAYDLRVEGRVAPLGIDEPKPRFAWRLASEVDGAAQRAYRLTIRAESGDVRWTSGWVETGDCFGIESDAELRSRTRYSWDLELRDQAGDEGSAGGSWFETGLFDVVAAGGVWIGRNRFADSGSDGFDPPTDDDVHDAVRDIPPAAYLRRGFAVPGSVDRARLYVTARGLYRAFLNGERVGADELTPGWTDYRDRVLYQTYDVTGLVRPGGNALGLVLADGWWSGYVAFDRRRQGNHYGVQPMGWCLLVIDHVDGSQSVVSSDGNWREARGAIFYTDQLMGEYVDQRNELGDWTSPEFDDTAWNPVAVLDDDLSSIAAQLDEPIRVVQSVPAVESVTDPDGRTLYDFGQNLVGRVRVDLGELPAGARVVLRHGEMLSEGRLYTANLRSAAATDIFVAAGGRAVFEPLFTIHGFRYLELSTPGRSPRAEDVRAMVMHNDFRWTGTLRTSSADVNRLVSNIEWGLRGNYVAVPTDCPQRDERLGWLADAQVFLTTATYLADVQAFFSRWLRDVRYAQHPEGSFADVAPVVTLFFGDGAPAWADAGVVMPWRLYRSYGDRRLLEASFDSMARYVDFLEAENPDLLWLRRVGRQYGDWLQVNAHTPRPVLATAYFAHSADLVAKAAAVVAPEREARYADLADRVKTAFVEAFVGPDCRIEGDSQTCYLLALAFDLVPQELRAAVAGHLVRTIEASGRLLTTGFVGVSLLCPVLSEIGRDDLAFALLETDRYPSWLYSVRHGATTIWERWDGWTDHAGFQSANMNSFNHYSLGSVGEWLYRYVAGIDQAPGSVGFDSLRYQPRVGGTLTSLDARFESPRGLIASRWERTGEDVEFRLELPPGMTASATLPAAASLEVDGRIPPEGPVLLGPGRHTLRARGLVAADPSS